MCIRCGIHSNLLLVCSAVVRVTFLNRGSDAYQRDLYPEYITVERTIDRDNPRPRYRLLAGDPDDELTGKITSKGSVAAVLKQFNIQVCRTF